LAKDNWYRLDNIGKFYSSEAGSTSQTVFRCAATLTDDIDPKILQRALDETVAIFPNFNVCLRSGMFWHYLEQAHTLPRVCPENLPVCFGLHVDSKSVLFRVSYYQQRINFEVSHMVADGRGALSFFKALIYLYVRQRYGVQGVSLDYEGTDRQKTEDSFSKYYDREGAGTTRLDKAYWISGWRDNADPTFFEYQLPADKAIALARSYDVGLTGLIIAALICAIRQEMPTRERTRPICVNVPVDLRQHFTSTTTKNFFGLTRIAYTPGDKDESFATVAAHVQAELKAATALEQLKLRMNRMIRFEKNLLLRLSPLFMKDLAIAVAGRMAARECTATISNLGRIAIDQRIAVFLRDINMQTSTEGMSLVICSFANILSIGISTVFANPDIVKDFCRFFSGAGIGGRVHINKDNKELAEDMREVRLETSLKRLGERGQLGDNGGGAAGGKPDGTASKNAIPGDDSHETL
jgi:NRPS condensation-like uncharacterized protein